MRKRYPIEIDDQLKQTVFYPYELDPLLQDAKRIAFGGRSCEATLRAHPQKINTIVISADIIEELHIPKLEVSLQVFYQNNTLLIGPLVGIFTSGFTPFPLRPIGDRSLFFSKLLSVQKSVGVVAFVFGEQHIDWENGLIEGYFYQKNGWERHLIPIPNVVYDRLPNRLSENRKEQRAVKERLKNEYQIPWYNPGFFNKLDIYEKLYNDADCYKYLPETVPFTSISHIEGMLSDYTSVYIKPINGSLGLGVHQVLYDKEQNLYFCRYHDREGEKRLQKFSSLERLINHVFRSRPLEQMLVQQGISLIKVDDRPVDFRIHTNKDENGFWQITAIAAKIAGTGSVTTHVKTGGIIKTVDEIFTEKERNIYVPKLKEVALKLSHALERQIDGTVGEIGFDLGIDKEGQIWLFEANSKPGRSIFTHPQLKEFEFLTRKLSLAFAVHLTERSIQSPEEVFR